MRRFALLVAVFMLIAAPVFASVGTVVDGVNRGVTDIKFNGTGTGDSITNTNGVLTFDLLLAGSGNGGGTSMATSDTTVDVTYSFHKKAVDATNGNGLYDAGTLPNGTPGQILTIYITERTSRTFTLTPTTSTQLETVAFDAVGETATFWWVDDTNGWALLSYTGATVTLEDGL